MVINGEAILPVSSRYLCRVISKDWPNQISSHDDKPPNMHANAPLTPLRALDFLNSMANTCSLHVAM